MALGSYSPEGSRLSMASRSLRQNRQSGAGGSRRASCLEKSRPKIPATTRPRTPSGGAGGGAFLTNPTPAALRRSASRA
jgi:hypothetical protein